MRPRSNWNNAFASGAGGELAAGLGFRSFVASVATSGVATDRGFADVKFGIRKGIVGDSVFGLDSLGFDEIAVIDLDLSN